MLRRARHAWLGAAFARVFKLMTKHADFFLIFLLQGHMRLFHRVYLFPDQLHLADLGRNLVLKAFRLTKLGFEFGSHLVEEFVEARRVARGDGPHAPVRVHGHVQLFEPRTTRSQYNDRPVLDIYVLSSEGGSMSRLKGDRGR